MSRKIGIYAAVLAAFALPLLYVPGVYDFVRWPRLLLLQILTVLMVGTWVGQNRMVRVPTHLATSILAFLGWQLLSTLWATNTTEALVRGSQALTFVVFGLSCALVLDADAIRTTIRAAALSTAIVAFICICQYWGIAFYRIPTAGHPSATFGYRNYLATYLVVMLPILVASAWTDSSESWRRTFWTISALVLAALLCTRTRGAWVAAAGMALITLGLVVLNDPRRLVEQLTSRRVAIGVAALLLVGTVGLQSPRMVSEGQFRIDEQKADALTAMRTTFSTTSSRGRLTVWGHTLDMVADYPITGVGLGSWQYRYPEYDGGDWITSNVAPQRPHNDLIWILAETGLIGLAFYGWFLLNTLLQTWKGLKGTHGALSGALGLAVIGYVTHGLFSYPMERIAASAAIWFSIGSLAFLSSEDETSTEPGATRWVALPAIALLLLCAWFTTQRIQFDTHYAAAVEAWRRSDWASVTKSAENAVAVGPYDFRAYQLLGAGRQQRGQMDEALEAYTASLELHPNEGHLPLADLHFEMADYANALEHYRIESGLYPRRSVALAGVARSALALSDWDTVVQTTQRLFDLKHQTEEVVLMRAEALQYKGDLVGAVASIEPLLASGRATSHAYTRYAAIQAKGGRWSAALRAYLKAAELGPQDPRSHNNVGVAHVRLRQYGDAAAAFGRAVEIEPGYARGYRNLGDVFEKLGDSKAAIDAYRRFVQHWKGDPAHIAWAKRRIADLGGTP